ncbi:MAG TPA: copper chaperone PCu(A)C [Steroidobacteraceae bacterium]|jgi:copper(I)-binding protein|nr:copper chaperone PCu(A)C [Steroidobacteraceae bacterium]
MLRLLLALPAVFALAGTAHAHHFSIGNLVIDHPWSRPTAAGMPIGVAYLSITNNGPNEDVLIEARTPLAARVEFHRSSLEAGIARMRPAGTVVIAPNTTVTATPGGLHLMLVDLNSALVAGTSAPLVLHFKFAGEITVQLMVEERDATATASH